MAKAPKNLKQAEKVFEHSKKDKEEDKAGAKKLLKGKKKK
jgi:hypothetical protein